jgi:tellurium resistance protein TerD
MQQESLCPTCMTWSIGGNCKSCSIPKPEGVPKRATLSPGESAAMAIARADLLQEEILSPPAHLSDRIYCKKCGSSQIATNAKGFGVGKALTGLVAVGPLGLVAGALGSSKLIVTCLACGNRWRPGH